MMLYIAYFAVIVVELAALAVISEMFPCENPLELP